MSGPITGGYGAWQQPGRWGRNEQGNYSLWSFEGTRREVAALAATFAQVQGLAYEVTEGFGKWRLEVHFPYGMNGIDPRTDKIENWEFFAQHAEKDLLDSAVENPNSVGLLTQNQIEKIRFFIQNPPDGTITKFPTQADFVLDSTDGGLAGFAIYGLMFQGVRNFPVEQPMLRRTVTTSNQYAVAYALTNIRKIISTATLVTLESMPTALLFNLPADVSNDNTRAYGWYKPFPTIQQVARLKWQIVQEWQYGLWATLIWGAPL